MCMYCGFTKCPSGCPNAPAPKRVAECHCCKHDILEGETVYEINGCLYHEDCVRDNAYDILIEDCKEALNVRYGTADSYSDFVES